MDRSAAARKVAALRQVTTSRGATPGEAATAQRLAARLAAAYNLDAPPPPRGTRRPRPSPRPPRPPTPTAAEADAVRAAFTRMYATAEEARRAYEQLFGYWFDPTTGEASENVKVHSYTDPMNWRIEIPPGGRGPGP